MLPKIHTKQYRYTKKIIIKKKIQVVDGLHNLLEKKKKVGRRCHRHGH